MSPIADRSAMGSMTAQQPYEAKKARTTLASASLMRVMMSRIGDGSSWESRSSISGASAAWASAHRVAAMTFRKPIWSCPSGVVRLKAW